MAKYRQYPSPSGRSGGDRQDSKPSHAKKSETSEKSGKASEKKTNSSVPLDLPKPTVPQKETKTNTETEPIKPKTRPRSARRFAAIEESKSKPKPVAAPQQATEEEVSKTPAIKVGRHSRPLRESKNEVKDEEKASRIRKPLPKVEPISKIRPRVESLPKVEPLPRITPKQEPLLKSIVSEKQKPEFKPDKRIKFSLGKKKKEPLLTKEPSEEKPASQPKHAAAPKPKRIEKFQEKWAKKEKPEEKQEAKPLPETKPVPAQKSEVKPKPVLSAQQLPPIKQATEPARRFQSETAPLPPVSERKPLPEKKPVLEKKPLPETKSVPEKKPIPAAKLAPQPAPQPVAQPVAKPAPQPKQQQKPNEAPKRAVQLPPKDNQLKKEKPETPKKAPKNVNQKKGYQRYPQAAAAKVAPAAGAAPAKKKKSGGLWRVLFVLSLGVFVVSLVALGIIGYGYLSGRNLNSEIAKIGFIPPDESAVKIAAGDKLEDMVVDWNALKAKNPDTVAWVYIPDTVVNYPVVQGRDNEKYLTVDFLGGKGRVVTFGTIFLAAENKADFSDPNSFLFGHHMQDGSMFACIDTFRMQDKFDAHREFYLLTPTMNYRLTSFSLVICDGNDPLVQPNFANDESRLAYYEDKLNRSVVSQGDKVIKIEDITNCLALVTCDYTVKDGRAVLFSSVVEKAAPKGATSEKTSTEAKAIGDAEAALQ